MELACYSEISKARVFASCTRGESWDVRLGYEAQTHFLLGWKGTVALKVESIRNSFMLIKK